MLYCPKCGKEVKSGDLFCEYCGTRTEEPNSIGASPYPQRNQQGFAFDRLNVGAICSVISAILILYVGVRTFTGNCFDREVFIHSSTVVFLNLVYLATGISSFFLLKNEKKKNNLQGVYRNFFILAKIDVLVFPVYFILGILYAVIGAAMTMLT